MHRAAGVRIDRVADRAAPGVDVTIAARRRAAAAAAPCRVVWTVDEPAGPGSGYGTLPGHPARGEEAFVVEPGATTARPGSR